MSGTKRSGAAIRLLAMAAALISCKSAKDEPKPGDRTKPAPTTDVVPGVKPPAPTPAVPDGSQGRGTITGVVTFTGDIPVMPVLDRSSDPVCARTRHKGTFVRVGGGAGLRDVVVRIPAGKAAGPVPTERIKIDQRECMFEPPVVAAMIGQELEITNSDATFHIAHGVADGQGVFSGTQKAGAPALLEKVGGKPGSVIKMSCSIHPWMLAHVVVSDHPYIAVTSADGMFELKGVPVGRYRLEAWHPHLGSRATMVTVSEDHTATVELTFDATSYKEPARGR